MSFLARRVDAITEMVRREHPDARDIAFVLVQCDGCGAELAAVNMSVLGERVERYGWLIDGEPPYHDYCPRCASAR